MYNPIGRNPMVATRPNCRTIIDKLTMIFSRIRNSIQPIRRTAVAVNTAGSHTNDRTKGRTAIEHAVIAIFFQRRCREGGRCSERCALSEHGAVAALHQCLTRQHRSVSKRRATPEHRIVAIGCQSGRRQSGSGRQTRTALEHIPVTAGCQGGCRKDGSSGQLRAVQEHRLVAFFS